MKGQFGQGVTTGPEVGILMSINLEPGALVEYPRIEKLLGMERREARFRTVVHAWIKRVFREQRLQHAAERGIGIRFLTESGALEHNIGAIKRTAKAERRIATKLRNINTLQLSEYERKEHQIATNYARARDSQARDLMKQLATPRPVTGGIVRLHA